MDAKERLKRLLVHVTPERGRFSYLAEVGGGSIDSWKGFWAGRQRPTIDMLEAVARTWPEYAFWLATGVTDQRNGHRAPPAVDTYPEPEMMIRACAVDYFKYSLRMKIRDEAGESQSLSDLAELKRLVDLRDTEATNFKQSEAVRPEEELAVQRKLDELATGKSGEARSFLLKVLDDLQRRKALTDEDFARMLGISFDELNAVRQGRDVLPRSARIIMIDKWGYTLLRDLVLFALPSVLATPLLQADIQHGQAMHAAPPTTDSSQDNLG